MNEAINRPTPRPLQTPNVTQDDILELLKTVYDPELGVNIVDLGLVDEIRIDDGRARIRMTLTTPG
ncbi:iron-sulfur cluster assembly protein, partial [Hydrogenibacillus schlegelii]|uniref:metal-sulfur cluster assembly factor n=1 Tax=Hydrogenibacillus schlegelii TaxID=1484 RepID=UPI0034A0A0B5